ncbi:MAG: T9SS type A sorting domain-containing protein [Crocinitomicaceae bacterium]|nr:T9SS type A sorting domain-containing protein [Crocinitomicaceae bacterium]
MAFPNPAIDVVTISIEAIGSANVTVTDVTGKLALTETVTLTNGNAKMNISSLEAGVYVFNVELENGETSQFNVIKK